MSKGIQLGKVRRRLTESKRKVLKEVANNSVNFFKVKVFDAQGFIDKSVNKWDEVKGKKGGKILVKSGNMRQSGKTIFVNSKKARIGFTAHYSSYHNEGAGNLKKRQIIGDSEQLDKENKKIIDSFIETIF